MAQTCKSVTTPAQRGGSAQYPGQALLTTTPKKFPIKVITAQTLGTNSPTGGGGGGVANTRSKRDY